MAYRTEVATGNHHSYNWSCGRDGCLEEALAMFREMMIENNHTLADTVRAVVREALGQHSDFACRCLDTGLGLESLEMRGGEQTCGTPKRAPASNVTSHFFT